MRVFGLAKESIVDGPGLRFAVFVQGCPHHCPGCHNPESLPFEGGYEAEAEALIAEFEKNPLLRGLTLSGGEPFCQARELIPLADAARRKGKDVWCFSGFTFEELLELGDNSGVSTLLRRIDVLVDGRFQLESRDVGLRFRGSANQRILDIPLSLAQGKAVPYSLA